MSAVSVAPRFAEAGRTDRMQWATILVGVMPTPVLRTGAKRFAIMKLPRRRYWVPLVLLPALCACAWFKVHYHFIGFWRGDAYYQGLPTSYWHDAASDQIQGPPKWLGPIFGGWFSTPLARTESLAVFRGDPKSVPVLIQIIEDPVADSSVRVEAIQSLSRLNERAPDELLDALRKHLQDPKGQLSYYAAWQLLKRDDDPTLAVKLLFDWHVRNSKSPWPAYREGVVIMLNNLATCRLDIDPSPMLDALRILQDDSDAAVRDSATEAIEKILKFHDGKR